MIRLYDSLASGNAWKVRLLLRHLGVPFERVTLNLAEGRQKTAEFAALNPYGRVPVVELPQGGTLYESDAILLHFAEGTPLLPTDPIVRNHVMAWLFYDQGDLSRFLGYPRFYTKIGVAEAHAAEIALYHQIADAALVPVEQALSRGPWLAGDAPTVADFALYPYIALSPEGGRDLGPMPAIRAWLARFEALPGYEPLLSTQS